MAITDRVRSFLCRVNIEDHPVPWDMPKITDDGRNARVAKIQEIEEN